MTYQLLPQNPNFWIQEDLSTCWPVDYEVLATGDESKGEKADVEIEQQISS